MKYRRTPLILSSDGERNGKVDDKAHARKFKKFNLAGGYKELRVNLFPLLFRFETLRCSVGVNRQLQVKVKHIRGPQENSAVKEIPFQMS